MYLVSVTIITFAIWSYYAIAIKDDEHLHSIDQSAALLGNDITVGKRTLKHVVLYSQHRYMNRASFTVLQS